MTEDRLRTKSEPAENDYSEQLKHTIMEQYRWACLRQKNILDDENERYSIQERIDSHVASRDGALQVLERLGVTIEEAQAIYQEAPGDWARLNHKFLAAHFPGHSA